jgi:hypothetical protein
LLPRILRTCTLKHTDKCYAENDCKISDLQVCRKHQGKERKKEKKKKKIIPHTFHNQTKHKVPKKLEIQQPHINICDPPLFGGTLFKIKFERTLSIG